MDNRAAGVKRDSNSERFVFLGRCCFPASEKFFSPQSAPEDAVWARLESFQTAVLAGVIVREQH